MALTLYKPGAASPSRSICIYGRAGVGKTTIVGTMPSRGLLIDVPQLEGGTEVLENKDNIDVTPVASWDEIDQVYQYLESGKHDYKWAAIDTITAFQELAKRKVIKDRDISASPHKITLQEFGQIGSLVGELIYKFRLLPIFTIWLAQERSFDAIDGQAHIMGPAVLPGALGSLLPSMMLVGRLKTVYDMNNKMERQLFVAPSPEHYTKVRTRPGIEIPTATTTLDLARLIRYFAGKEGATIDFVKEATLDLGFDLAGVGAAPAGTTATKPTPVIPGFDLEEV